MSLPRWLCCGWEVDEKPPQPKSTVKADGPNEIALKGPAKPEGPKRPTDLKGPAKPEEPKRPMDPNRKVDMDMRESKEAKVPPGLDVSDIDLIPTVNRVVSNLNSIGKRVAFVENKAVVNRDIKKASASLMSRSST